MISQRMQDALNDQIGAEFYSAYLYLAMASHADSMNLKGFAHWIRVQYQEETLHTLKIIDFLQDRGGRVQLKAIEAPPSEFGTALQLFEAILEHEIDVTKKVHRLYEIALEEKDYATQVFLQWFITEQVEEEDGVSHILEKIRMMGERSSGLIYLDKELGKRESAFAG